MLSFETAISSILVLAAFLMVFGGQLPTHNEPVSFYNSLQLYDYANILAQSPCDFSKLSMDSNFCYSCHLTSSSKLTYSNPICAASNSNSKLTIHLPVFTNEKIDKMSVSKYTLPN